MFAFRVGWIEVVSKWCARSMPQSTERSHPRRASGLDAFRCADVQRRFVCCPYAIAASRKGVLVRYMACRVTASFRANATLALRGPVRSAIALAQPRRREPLWFLHKIAFAASNRHFLVKPSPLLDTRPFLLISPDS